RGPNVFAGYWRDPDATSAALSGGWLHSGDVAERDAGGFYRICGRIKDVYISGGENVYPAEVEGVLHDHPAVAEAAVVGIPDERWGEAGLAVVAARPGVPVGEDELLVHCRDRLAGFKVPRAVRFVAALPRNSVGKVQKSMLAQSGPEGDR
ncbi:MAG: AMP-binding enzyme, partial [Acidimicrobiales bacterium]